MRRILFAALAAHETRKLYIEKNGDAVLRSIESVQ